MNKKTLRIAGWALGLSMAVAGIGAVVGASQKAPIETKAAVTTYEITEFTGSYSASGGTTTVSGVTWTYSSSTYAGKTENKFQVGSSKKPQTTPWTFATPVSSFGENIKITALSVTAYTTATTATYDISVGGSSVKSGSLTTSSSTYSISSLSATSGDIVFTLTGSSGSKAMYLVGLSVTYESNVTLYDVTFDSNGGSGDSMDSVKASSNYTVPSPTYTAPEGKYFSYWTTSADGTGTKYYPGDTVDINADTDLYAIWSDPVTLTYKANGGVGEDISEIYGAGYKATVSGNSFDEPETKEFLKWNLSAGGTGSNYAENDKIIVSADTSLYAIWTDAEEGSIKNPYTAARAIEVVNGGVDTPTDTKYVKGWVYSISGKNIYIGTNKTGDAASAQFEFYSTSGDLSGIEVGDYVIGKGKLKWYAGASQAEFESGCTIVEHNEITTIAVTGTPSKTIQYAGDAFDASGLTFTAHYHLGPDDPISSGIVWDDLEVGEKPSGTYKGKSFDVDGITILENVLTIEISGSLSDNTFDSDESWNHTGLIASGSYANGSSYEGEIEWLYSPATPSLMGPGENQDLTITARAESGETDTKVVKVNVNAVAVEITDIKVGDLIKDGSGNYNLNIPRTNDAGYDLSAYVYPTTALDKRLDYESSNPSKISVSSEGLVELHGAVIGDKADITITTKGNTANGYEEVSVIVKVTVTREAQTVALNRPATYQLVTDESTISDGDKIVIAALDYDYAISTTQNTNNRGQASVEKDGSSIFWESDVQVFDVGITTVEEVDYFTFYDAAKEGYLYAASSSSNNMKTQTKNDNNGLWTIDIDSDTNAATILAQGTNSRNWLRYNNSNNLFSCYGSGQSDVAIYKLTDNNGDMAISDELFQAVMDAESHISCQSNGVGSTYNWSSVTAEFGAYSGTPATFVFKTAAWEDLKYAVADENGNETEQFLARYDYIVGKYKEDDFLGRSEESVFSYDPANNIVAIDNNVLNEPTLFVAIAASVGLLTTGGIFLISRRRREE